LLGKLKKIYCQTALSDLKLRVTVLLDNKKIGNTMTFATIQSRSGSSVLFGTVVLPIVSGKTKFQSKVGGNNDL
jgi:hypothetical protein